MPGSNLGASHGKINCYCVRGGAVPLLAMPVAQAAPCLIVTITGAGAGPQVYQGQAGPGTLIRYGDDGDNCNAVRLQFDAGRGTLLRLSGKRPRGVGMAR